MRSFCVLFIAVAACSRQLPPDAAAHVATSNCGPPPSATPSPPANTTPLHTEAVDSPTARTTFGFVAPELGGQIDPEGLATYAVQLELRSDEPLGIELALDGERPRRLPDGETRMLLQGLLPAGAVLSPGAHWLFAAPVSKAGLVPRPTPSEPRTAIARRFFLGPVPSSLEGPSGAVWLRKPEGTYNGAAHADRVLFDAYAFSATGLLLAAPCTIGLQSASIHGEIRLPAPFVASSLASGDYEVTVSAPAAQPVTSHFTVNRELGSAQ